MQKIFLTLLAGILSLNFVAAATIISHEFTSGSDPVYAAAGRPNLVDSAEASVHSAAPQTTSAGFYLLATASTVLLLGGLSLYRFVRHEEYLQSKN